MEKNQLTPKESLEVIQQMIAASRQNFADKAIYMIVWGVVLIVACLVNYVLLFIDLEAQTRSNSIIVTWIGLPILAGIWSYIIGCRQTNKKNAKTHIDNLLRKMWFGYGIALFFIIFFCADAHRSPIPFILLLTGFATFVFGLGVKYTPFIIGSICFTLFAIVAYWASLNTETAHYQLLIFGGAIVVGYLIPGLLLYKKVKTEKA